MDIQRLLEWTCMHSETTEPDENGDAICFRCGMVIQIRFNLKRFQEQIRKLYDVDK